MKTIKLFLLLAFLFGFTPIKSQELKTHVDRNGYTYDWKLSNKICYGCGAFYACVTRTANPDEKGLYYFYIYFWSKSYYANGGLASTYITNINIYGTDKFGNVSLITGPYYFVAFPKTESFNGYNLAATIYSTDPSQIINITWGQVTAY